MVLKGASVLSCLIPARLGYPRSDSPAHARDQEKHPKHRLVALDHLGNADLDPFRGDPLLIHRATDPSPQITRPELSRARANTAPSTLPSSSLMPNGSIDELPKPFHCSLAPPVRPKRSSFTNFFAFSSKRRSAHGAPIVIPKLQRDLLVPPRSVPGSGRPHVHLVNPTSIPSPLRTDDEEYYYYVSPSPASPSHSTSHNPDATNRCPPKQLSAHQQDLIAHPDLESQLPSPVDSHLTHTQIRHPYAYSTPLYSKPCPKLIDTGTRLRHATSQPFQHHPQDSRSSANVDSAHNRMPPSHLGHEVSKSQPHLSHSELKASMSTPNLASGIASVRPRSLLRKQPSTRSKAQERWLSAESWWDALFSPSPRFKVKQAPRPSPATHRVPITEPVQDEPNRNMAVTFPSILATRPRAASVTSAASNIKRTAPSLARSRSAVDLSGQPSTSAAPRAGFEPALETLVDQPTPPPDRPSSDSELPLPGPPLSLEEVLDEGEAFEQQRAKWKEQASKSLGNKHTRSFSRARSKSFSERQVRLGRHASESTKAQLNLEFLAARTLLGSQSMMPVVHVSKPSSSSFHSKAYSHSHSQSAYSFSHSSHSRAYSHSHSHSLTTSNSSKSSRNIPPRAHSRNGSWGKTFLKAGALCGIGQDDSNVIDEKVPSSSRVGVQGIIVIGHSANAGRVSAEAEKVSPPPNDPIGEVGIAISSSPPLEGSFDLEPRHQEDDQESRRHTHKSSEYAGPHPSVIDSNLPPLGGASDVSMRHRLPPRAAIHPPIAPIAHPYRSAAAQPGQLGNKGSESATSKATDGQESTEPCTGCNPHLSLSHPDFERYGVGEALVYASPPRPEVLVAKQIERESQSSPAAELSSCQDHSPSCDTTVLQCDRDSSSLAMNNVPSLTNSTIQMVMSAFNNPDALDEFQDLFYKPHFASEYRRREPTVVTNQVSTDVHSSTSSSPLTHLVRKLSEEVHSLRNPSRTPSDPIFLQRSESCDSSNKSGSNLVFTDIARSSSPPPIASSSQLHVPIAEPSETTSQPVTAIPEDVNSFYTSSILESPLEDRDNDTFGYPVKHGQLEAVVATTTVQSSIRTSTHLSIQEDGVDVDDDETAFLRPVTRRYGLVSVDAVRASYVTTSDLSQMSGLSDFPLPPGARPVSILHAYSEATQSASSSDDHDQSDEETEMGHRDGCIDGEPSGDVEATLRALRTARVTSYESRRSTFGGSEDMDFITELHQAGP